MNEKRFFGNTNPAKFIFRSHIAGLIIMILVGSAVISSAARASLSRELISVSGLFYQIKGFLQNKFPAQRAAVIKVVSEESQVINVVKKASPAVVSIFASTEVPKLEECSQGGAKVEGLPSELEGFFNLQIQGLCQVGTEKKRVSAGSGFLVSEDGYIVTNKHVVDDEKAEYTVILNDVQHFGKKLRAKILARDPNNDVAVLKINMDYLPFLTFADSAALQVGQTAIAIGYALGEFDKTVSKGVVSRLSRSDSETDGRSKVEQLSGVIQTDAAINPGNSGGPLLDLNGKVIGMNVAMASAQSIGFAIPGNIAKSAFKEVHDYGIIKLKERALLGVRYIPVTLELVEQNKLPYDYGMLITRGKGANEPAVLAGSPADKAGIVENDIILEIDGRKLNDRYLLADAIEKYKPGDEVGLKIYHENAVRLVRIKLEKK